METPRFQHSILPPLSKNVGSAINPSFQLERQALIRRIRIVLANQHHLDRAVSDAFQIAWGTKQQVNETHSSTGSGAGATGLAEATVEFDTATELLLNILTRIELPFDKEDVLASAADACRTFALSRAEADAITEARVRFVIDWALQSLAESTVRRSQEDFYNRQFLFGLEHDSAMHNAGLQLSGPVAYGVYGNVWLHAKMKQSNDRHKGSSTYYGTDHRDSHSTHLRVAAGRRQEHVVISVPKHLCRVPPEILSRRLQELIEMERIPHVLPLMTAYEDHEHIHLVYEPLASHAICVIDKVFDDLHSLEDEKDGAGVSERLIQQFTWKMLTMLKAAHARGLVHGSLRLGSCYMNDAESWDSLQILEFGIYDLFDRAAAQPPLSVLTPLELDRLDPVPPYRKDLQCVAEITYLLLGGHPICPIDFSSKQQQQYFKRGTVSFVDKVFVKVSEYAKAFVVELLRPPQFKKQTRIQACHEVAIHMAHRWFLPSNDEFDHLAELYDVTMMRKYDRWRNMIRLRTVFLKIISDNASLNGISRLRQALTKVLDDHGKVSWAQLVTEIQLMFPIITFDLLKKVNKAFGDNTHTSVIHVADLCDSMSGWRRKRVREVLWQVFSRSKAFDGIMPADACIDGLTSGVLHVWSRPLRVVDVVFPAEGLGGREAGSNLELEARLEELVGGQKVATFGDLVTKTDASGPV